MRACPGGAHLGLLPVLEGGDGAAVGVVDAGLGVVALRLGQRHDGALARVGGHGGSVLDVAVRREVHVGLKHSGVQQRAGAGRGGTHSTGGGAVVLRGPLVHRAEGRDDRGLGGAVRVRAGGHPAGQVEAAKVILELALDIIDLSTGDDCIVKNKRQKRQ